MDRRNLPEFSDYDKLAFEHAAEEETGTKNAEVINVDDIEDEVTVRLEDDREVKMKSDDYGLPYISE